MKEKNQTHWAILEIADQEIPGNTINLWSRVETQVALPGGKVPGTINRRLKKQVAFVLVPALLLIGSFFFVPACRAFAEVIIQRMGIAFVDTTQFDPKNAQVQKAEATKNSNLAPSLSIEEVRAQIGFPLLLPAWLPDGLTYINRGITEYTPQSGEGSGKKLAIEYGRTADFDSANGLLYLYANDGLVSSPPLLAEARQQQVTVNGQPGIYVHGGWQDDGSGDPNTKIGALQWDDQSDDAYLTWTQDGVTYLLEAHNLGANLDVLLQIAASMKSQ